MRASFNSETFKPYTSRHSYFRALETHPQLEKSSLRYEGASDSYDLDAKEHDKIFDRHGIMRKLTPWHSSDFSLGLSPIKDERFGCTNNSLLEKLGEKTFYELKRNVLDSQNVNQTLVPSCRSCIEDRHKHSLKVRDKVKTLTQFIPVDCALKPMIVTQGLGVKMEVSVRPGQNRNETLILIDDLKLGQGLSDEFRYRDFNSNNNLGGFEFAETNLNVQKITINFDKIDVSDMFSVAQIWEKQGYRENLYLGFNEKIKLNRKDGMEGLEISPKSMATTLDKMLSEIRKYWNPSLYPGPEFFLERDFYPRIGYDLGREEKKHWEVQYLKMGEETLGILESGLSKTMLSPIILGNEGVGKISVYLDNTELWM